MTYAEKWLKLIAIIHIVGGLLLPLIVFTPVSAPYFEHLLEVFPQSNLTSIKFLIGVFGPTVASWGLLFYYAAEKAFEGRTKKDWWFLLVAILVWSIMDTAFSLYFDVMSHLWINGLVAVLFVTPLLIYRPTFTEN
ncbi:hypothetical protein DZA50_00620 [Kangiella sp. HD9-110m-PIT-SAG07]|nr:hypothetical protein DZA50_00620 [Kangiella sp. HD9-110m-PIT-SAG07]